MIPREVVGADDEQFALLLARYSEALTAGAEAEPADDATFSPELRRRLQRALRCLRRLRQFQVRHPVAFASAKANIRSIQAPDGNADRKVGRYIVRHAIGQGGCGIVFLAFDPVLGRDVALKVPHLEALLTPELRRRFLCEARAAAGLNHPNLVPVHDVGETNGLCYIVSAYYSGGTLADWLEARTTPVPVRQAAELLVPLAEAMHHVHEQGIYHRDIKPSNILLDFHDERLPKEGRQPSGKDSTFIPKISRSVDNLSFTPRLTDFGLAKQLDNDSGQTASGMVIGTLNYMAPEQLECHPHDIGPHTDVFGLGAVLYELLTGRPPFKGATNTETLDQVLFKAPVRPRRLRSDVPRDLESICLKCLEKSSERRYDDATKLAADLRRFLAGQSIEARPPSLLKRLGKWLRRIR